MEQRDYKGRVRGKVIELEESLPYENGEEVAVTISPLPLAGPPGSPQAILDAARQPPHLRPGDVEALEQAIEDSALPPTEERPFDSNDDV